MKFTPAQLTVLAKAEEALRATLEALNDVRDNLDEQASESDDFDDELAFVEEIITDLENLEARIQDRNDEP